MSTLKWLDTKASATNRPQSQHETFIPTQIKSKSNVAPHQFLPQEEEEEEEEDKDEDDFPSAFPIFTIIGNVAGIPESYDAGVDSVE